MQAVRFLFSAPRPHGTLHLGHLPGEEWKGRRTCRIQCRTEKWLGFRVATLNVEALTEQTHVLAN